MGIIRKACMYPFDKALLGSRRDGKPGSALETIFLRKQTVSAMIRDYSHLLLKELA